MNFDITLLSSTGLICQYGFLWRNLKSGGHASLVLMPMKSFIHDGVLAS